MLLFYSTPFPFAYFPFTIVFGLYERRFIVTLIEAKQRFDELLEIQFMSAGTKNNYRSYVNRFLAFCKGVDVETTDQLELHHYQDFILHLSKAGYHSSTIGTCVSAIRTFSEAVLGIVYTKRQIPKPRTVREEAFFFTDDQIACLLANCNDIRLRVWIILGYDCGLRVSEVANLKWSDFDKASMTITIHNSKRNKTRVVPYSPYAKQALVYYCRSCGINPSTTKYLFPGRKKGEESSISSATISSHFKMFIKNFPFATDRAHFHSLRHSYAVSMLSRVGNPYELATLMGHSSIQTTMNYVHLSPKSYKNFSSPCHDWKYKQ